ncbi:tyrosine-protein phosphatase [Streptomonospora nanhaiensis]|uniref:Protein-tyrosine phosphatase n=1 Tax=Streptomonospora nanhaiensis TaxID=1323731 RepID=A0A853BUI6_9ACTN|nr:tyrosine-protein phosphatase [Streptomonospora nanhaiensis]MBV2363602.1 tyrosine-protein phosphatase [Streptomonospora nanhaiensis]MBX9389884.1 tyrosine-protein phosphatase [Streptomonospora nanhaiensis]NYI98644.1 protein-tyrosine phosphatase [Streptomonospora nanhaiensis]
MTNQARVVLPTAPNFRDLGGYTTHDGARVRPGVAYRSDALHRLSDDDLRALGGLGVRQVVDLRTEFERQSNPDRVPDGAEYTSLDVQGDHSTGADLVAVLSDPARARTVFADGGAERFMHDVNRILVSGADARAGYAELLRRVAAGPGATVFHCSAGKDRTGWGAALLLTLLGVPRETVFADYLASNGRLAHLQESFRAAVEGAGVDLELVWPMVECRTSYLETAFTEVEKVYGSFGAYAAEGLGLAPGDLAALRERMLE